MDSSGSRLARREWDPFFLFTLVSGPRRSLSLKLSDTRASNTSPPGYHREWDRYPVGGLRGSTMGILGYGDIGYATAHVRPL